MLGLVQPPKGEKSEKEATPSFIRRRRRRMVIVSKKETEGGEMERQGTYRSERTTEELESKRCEQMWRYKIQDVWMPYQRKRGATSVATSHDGVPTRRKKNV